MKDALGAGEGVSHVSADVIITSLFIFVLASLVGFEVIRRVPKLLHTPLMALTNALSAIALVGSIVILGQTETTYAKVLGFIAVVCLDDQRGRRLHHHRPHAEDVQAARAASGRAPRTDGRRRLMDRMDWINLAYLFAAVGFAMSLKWMSAPATARRGVLAGELGFGLAIVATLFWPDMTTEGYVLIAVAALIGSAIGVPLGLMVPMTAMPQRIALSHAFGGLAAALVGTAHYYLDATSHLNEFDTAVLGIEIVLGFLVVHGQPDGRRQAAGVAAAAADHLQGPERGELRGPRRGPRRCVIVLVVRPDGRR